MYRWFPSQVSLSCLIVIATVACPLLPISLIRNVEFHDNQRIIEIFCVALSAIVAVGYLLRIATLRCVHNRRLVFNLLLFLLFGLVSGLFAYSPRHALLEWANFLLLFGTSALIAHEVAAKGRSLLDQILRLCWLGCAAYICIEIVIYLIVITVGSQPPNTMLIYGFDNYRFFNHIQTICLPLLGLVVCRNDNGKKNIFSWAIISLWWTLLFVSAGRGTFIGLFAGICASWFCLRQDAMRWCRIMLLTALIGLGIYFLFYVLIPLLLGLQPFGFLFSIVDRTMENPSSSRWQLWIRALEIMLAHPWLGAGPLHFAHFGRVVQNGAHPHNWILQIACEWGIPALLCLMTAIALGFKRLLSVRQYLEPADVKNHATLAAWLTIGVAILVDGLVSGLIVMPTSQLWIALYIGCAWGWVVSMTPVKAEAALHLSVTVRTCSVVVMLAAIYFLANGLWPEILNLPLYEEQNLQKDLYPNPVFHPRIWAGGYF